MQQMGDNTLALVRALVGADLTEYTVPTGDAVYFNVPPRLMVHFSAGWAWVLVVLAVLLVIGLVAFARIRRVVMLRQVVGGCVAVLFLVAAVVFAGSAYWAALKWIEPGSAASSSTARGSRVGCRSGRWWWAAWCWGSGTSWCGD